MINSSRSSRTNQSNESRHVAETAFAHNPISPTRLDHLQNVTLSGRVISNRSTVSSDKHVGRAVINAIPGYSGFVPGKLSESVIAASFTKANLIAQHIQCGNPPKDVTDLCNPRGLLANRGASIPGYKGYIPGRYAENVIGETFKRANEVSFAIKRRQYSQAQSLHDRQVAAGERIFGPRRLEGNSGFYPLYRSLMRD